MSITVNLYTFAKKVNSTGRPSTSPLVLDCVLKDSCSIIYPVIGVDKGLTWNPAAYNYAYISAFNRYYYINDWSFAEGLWWVAMGVDALATWRTEILNNTSYVARAAKSYDGNISDTLFPATSEVQTHTSFITGTWQVQFNNGFYVVGIINNDSSSIGAVSYYAFTPSQFASLKAFLLGDTTWTGIFTTNPDIGDSLYKSLFNPFQYISSVNWFPLSFDSSWGTLLSSLKFGWWELNPLACYRLTTYEYRTSVYSEISVPAHPQASARGAYLNTSPFTTYRLVFPPFGEFELDGSMFNGESYSYGNTVLPYEICVDFISGAGELQVFKGMGAENQATLLVAQSIVAVPIQIAQITSNKWGEIRTTGEAGVSMLGSAISGDVSGAISSLATGVFNAIEARIPHSQQQGSNGSLTNYRIEPRLECIYHMMADDALSDKGRPLCSEVQLSTLYPGYVMVVGAHVEIAGTETEITSVNDALDGGVYLE